MESTQKSTYALRFEDKFLQVRISTNCVSFYLVLLCLTKFPLKLAFYQQADILSLIAAVLLLGLFWSSGSSLRATSYLMPRHKYRSSPSSPKTITFAGSLPTTKQAQGVNILRIKNNLQKRRISLLTQQLYNPLSVQTKSELKISASETGTFLTTT